VLFSFSKSSSDADKVSLRDGFFNFDSSSSNFKNEEFSWVDLESLFVSILKLFGFLGFSHC